MCRILVADGMNKEQIENLKELGFDVIDEYYDGEELGLMCQDVDALVIRSKNKITKEIIDKALEGNARLKLIIRSGVGLDNIDVKYATQKGIKVMNTPCASTRSVAELTIGQIITIARFVNIANVTMRDGEWNKKQYIGTEIFGKTLLSIHNVNFLLKLASDIREAIKEDSLLDFKEEFLDKYGHDVYKRAF